MEQIKVQTKCEGCVFAITSVEEQVTQTGCTLNRSQNLGCTLVANDDGDEFYELSRFCNTYRPAEWVDLLTDEEREEIEEVALDEVCPKLGIMIFADPNTDESLDSLRLTIDSIKNINPPPRYVVVNNTKVEYNEGIQEILSSSFDFEETEYHLVLNLFDIPDVLMIDESFKHVKQGYVYITSSGETVDGSITQKIHERININMKRLALVKPYKELNGLLFQASLFKFLKGSIPRVDAELQERDVRTFLQRVDEMPREDPDLIVEWEEFIRD